MNVRLLPWACALPLFAACGDDPGPIVAPPGARNLLTSVPDGLVEQPGRLRPTEERQWMPYARLNWLEYTLDSSEGLYVWGHAPRQGLDLYVVDSVDRTIEFTAWLPTVAGAPETETVVAWLNGKRLGEVELGRSPRELEVEALGPLWRHGRNLFELEVEQVRVNEYGAQLSLALAEVSYDVERRVEHDRADGELTLDSGTRARWHHEGTEAARLLVTARGESGGQIVVRFRAFDSRTGTYEDADLSEARLLVQDGLAHGEVEIPTRHGSTVRIEVAWEGEDELEFDELAIDGAARMEMPSILFLSIDTLAAGHMSVYGYERETTPNLERFAEDAVVFERCATNAPWTLPSYMSQMTGLYPHAHRLDFAGWREGRSPQLWDNWELAPNRWTIAEALRARGYFTGGFVDNLWLTEKLNFPQGFDVYDSSAGDIELEDPDGGIRRTAPLAREWISGLPTGEPFFAFVHAFDVHGPYMPEPNEQRFHGDGLWSEAMVPAGGTDKGFGAVPEYIAASELELEDLEETPLPPEIALGPIHADYDEEIFNLDADLGELFAWMKSEGLYDDTLIVISSDHGETIDQKNFYFGHGVIWEPVRHIPLMIKLPKNQRAGSRVAREVQLVDLYPTFLEVSGLEPRRPELHGQSLMPALEGEGFTPKPTYTQAGVMQQFAIEMDGWKLLEMRPRYASALECKITSPYLDMEPIYERVPALEGRVLTQGVIDTITEQFGTRRELGRFLGEHLPEVVHELYYLPDDPGELNNLAEAEPEKLAELLERASDIAERIEVAKGHAISSGMPVTFSEDEMSELAAIGYSGDDGEEEGDGGD